MTQRIDNTICLSYLTHRHTTTTITEDSELTTIGYPTTISD